MDIYQHRRHNKNLLMVHLIFATKYRKRILFSNFREDIKQFIFDSCVSHCWYIKRMETDKDHIHILLQYKPTDSITNNVTILKQESTHSAWKYHSDFLRQYYWKAHTLWSDSYYAMSVGMASCATIEHYIETQG